MDNLESLVEQMCSGDTDAFDALFRQYEKTVYRTAYLITGERETASDLLQEVLISVWQYRKTYNPVKGKFSTWLHRITVNRCNRKLSKMNKNTPLSIDKMQDSGIQINAAKSESPEEINITREEYKRLLNALAGLSSGQRAVLVLRFFNDLSYDEIAAAVGISLGTVKSRLNAALKRINRSFYSQEDAGYGL